MRSTMRSAAVLAVAATMFLVGMIVASAASSAGSNSTGPSPDQAVTHAARQAVPLTTNTSPVATYVPSPQDENFVAIAPCRIVDTRVAGGPLGTGSTRNFAVSGSAGFSGQGGNATGCGIPASAVAVSMSIIAVNPGASGHLTAWAAGASQPTASVLNFQKGQNTNTGAIVTIRPAANPALSLNAGSGPVNVVIDVTGYYEPQMHLIILANGTVWYGNNAHLTEVIHTSGTGAYTLVFDRDTAGCNVLTTNNGQQDVQTTGSWGGTTLIVDTFHQASGVFTQTDEGFQVFMIC